MKTLIAIVATALTGLALPQQAQAGHPNLNVSVTYQSGHSACGCASYTQRIFTGYDCYGRPIYRYVSVPIQHRCGHSHGRSYSNYSNRGYEHSGYSRGGYSRSGYGSPHYSYRGPIHGGYSRGYQSRTCR